MGSLFEAENELGRSYRTYEEQDIMENERKRRKNVSETVTESCLCLSLSLRPLWHCRCQVTPLIPMPNSPSRQSLSTISWSSTPPAQQPPPSLSSASQSPFPTHLCAPEPSPSSTTPPLPKTISSTHPLPVWAIPRPPRNRTVVERNEKPDLSVPPYEWATMKRAIVHDLDHLVSRQILKIPGEFRCKRCKGTFKMQYNLLEKFREIGIFINENHNSMLDRAPIKWMSPNLPKCRHCRAEKSVKPYIPSKKRSINWLFLFLGEMIGCCRLMELKYFLKQLKEHRTGAKDRVVYSTYFELCRQLDPSGKFFISLIS